jgi:hypothetical protein
VASLLEPAWMAHVKILQHIKPNRANQAMMATVVVDSGHHDYKHYT